MTNFSMISDKFIADDFVPEQFESECVLEIQEKIRNFVHLTPYSDQLFLNGFVRKVRPRKILEVGVLSGGSSAIILNAVKDDPAARLYSVDKAEFVPGRTKPIGHVVSEVFPQFLPQWTLYKGGMITEFIGQIGDGIDFCFLDAAHALPGEILDFLVALPYLNDNTVVVLHDINLHLIYPKELATGTVLNVVDERKWIAAAPEYGFGNMGAFQVGRMKTRARYVDDLFRSLSYPWGYDLTDSEFQSAVDCLSQHYRADQIVHFQRAHHLKTNPYLYDYPTSNINDVLPTLEKDRKTVLCGSGRYGSILLRILNKNGFSVDCFADNDPGKIGKTLEGIPIVSIDDIAALAEPVNLLFSCTWVAASQLMKQLHGTPLYDMVKNPVPVMM